MATLQTLRKLLTVTVYLLFALLPTWCNTFPTSSPPSVRQSAGEVPAVPFFYFPDNKQAENLIIRLNGQILVTLDTAPELYQISPLKNYTGGLVHSFTNYTSLFGIVELTEDIFYVIASNFSGPPDYFGFAGTVSLFEVDLRGFPDPLGFPNTTKISKVMDIPCDAQTGVLYPIDVSARTSSRVLQSTLLNGTSIEASAGLAHVGANGLKYRNGTLYWSNTARGAFGSVPIDQTSGTPLAEPSMIENYGTDVDDFSFDRDGNLFLSEDEIGVLFVPAGKARNWNETRLITSLLGADANAFGRCPRDRYTLYSLFAGSPSGIASIQLVNTAFCQ